MADYNGIPFNGGLAAPTGTGAQHIVQTLQAIIDFLIACTTPGVLQDAGNFQAIDWLNRLLFDGAGQAIADWGHTVLIQPGTSNASVDWGNLVLNDASNANGVRWSARQLIASDGGTVILQWDSGVQLPNLPTSDPGLSGHLWNNGGQVMVSP